ncbi:conserved protein of unknown function [Xenorhabdus poinarii G6]|uniref:Uncharacterized protein n=1 Tax=Xenorhabdus poinarii G6 TaxID=1354304 RepID=A0A068R1M4_9GAMM|nr:hypothetical protein [Xenorhabdus poinarii]CDG20776.1 conserved protein of unknown function [Xenorhabdus poinarii G6]
MNKTETEQLVKELLKHSEPYRPEKQIAPEKPTVKRTIQRDRS